MNPALIFDVDGTLTPSRNTIDPDFANWFNQFQKSHDTYLVSGSDYPKTLEQVGPQILESARLVFNCCGNEVRRGTEILHQESWMVPADLTAELERELSLSPFELRTGQHIEHRTGLLNFSILGRGADRAQRKQYVEYDQSCAERRSIVSRLSQKFSNIEFAIAGETGIDIYPAGKDKSQALNWITAEKTIFFGDATWPGGNDHPIARACDEFYQVANWQETYEILKHMAR